VFFNSQALNAEPPPSHSWFPLFSLCSPHGEYNDFLRSAIALEIAAPAAPTPSDLSISKCNSCKLLAPLLLEDWIVNSGQEEIDI